MSKKRGGFRQRYGSMTQIGRTVGLSARALGAKLKELGVRQADGSPSPQALDDGLAVATPMKDGTPHYMWDRKRVIGLLADNGVRKDADGVEELRIRDAVGELLQAVGSEEYAFGGGLGYKIICDEILDNIMPRLPLPAEIRRVRKAVHASRAEGSVKQETLVMLAQYCAQSDKLDDETAAYLLEREDDEGVLRAIADNKALGERVRAAARAPSEAQAGAADTKERGQGDEIAS